MRRSIILILILLTVLRAWAGDVMAVEMLHGVPTISVQATSSALVVKHCHTEINDEAEIALEAQNCAACEFCHFPALQTNPSIANVSVPPAGYSRQASAIWGSADLVRLNKPPVS